MDSAQAILLGGSAIIFGYSYLNEKGGLKRVAEWLLDRVEEAESGLWC